MRIPAEALDNRPMAPFEVKIALQPRLIEKPQGFLVDHGRFAVHVRHIDERALFGGGSA